LLSDLELRGHDDSASVILSWQGSMAVTMV
jgi:hypothetical protein